MRAPFFVCYTPSYAYKGTPKQNSSPRLSIKEEKTHPHELLSNWTQNNTTKKMSKVNEKFVRGWYFWGKSICIPSSGAMTAEGSMYDPFPVHER